jgi:hypothetical protein
MRLKCDELLLKPGAARGKARAAWRLVDIEVDPQIATSDTRLTATATQSAPDLPSSDRADRSAHLRHLHGLLSPPHVACKAEPVGGRPHAEAVLDKFAAIQILDVGFPTTEVRT